MHKILIADGCEDFRLALANILQDDYIVRTCADGDQALQLLHSFSPDILVLDLMISGLDGLSLLQSAAETDTPPTVVATSRFLSDYVIETAKQLGVMFLAAKPCSLNAIAARIAATMYTSGKKESPICNSPNWPNTIICTKNPLIIPRDPKDMKPVGMTEAKNRIAQIGAIRKSKANRIPMEHAIPFPPLNLR